MVYINNSDELYHYGVKGMRWGHRKAVYQNTAARGIVSTQKPKLPGRVMGGPQKQKMPGYAKVHLPEKTSPGNSILRQKYLDAKANKKDAKKEYKQTDEYKAKRAKAIKVGVAVAGTALAAYGAYKVSKVLKDKAAAKSYKLGMEKVNGFIKKASESSRAGNFAAGTTSYQLARSHAALTDKRTAKVSQSTVEAAKYLWKTRNQ